MFRPSGLQFDEERKFHHFAFEASAPRVAELQEALIRASASGDALPLRRFHDRHVGAFVEEASKVMFELPADELEILIDDVDARLGRPLLAPLRGRGQAPLGAWDEVYDVAYRLARLIELSAPPEIIDGHVERLSAFVASLLAGRPWIGRTAYQRSDDDSSLITSCVDLCILLPFPPNLGIGGLYDVLDPIGRMNELGEDPWFSDLLLPPGRLVEGGKPALVVHRYTVSAGRAPVLESNAPAEVSLADLAGYYAVGDGEALTELAALLAMPLKFTHDEDAVHFSADDTVLTLRISETDPPTDPDELGDALDRYAEACEEIAENPDACLIAFIEKND